ncbi:stage III sporulation protein AG [Aneurinibacillus sp. Ricciae_BoGa-3]|uniref:stage III sporulation protein AG n=1 Tax=Aneurinibacillus sp. Ricciae_BoGa-3 TaxID=3022697 RepID=UPI002340F7CB|nr:stage III sporulation protein AG [Aneurinibacillus sp. Ricciae_BoGa-3]WCK53149.1 stage III sporulation protein AG [Aneurinibacillus sp. Ricciae_BoGa-3]
MSQDKWNLKRIFAKTDGKGLGGFQAMIIVAGVGVAIMLASSFISSQQKPSTPPQNQNAAPAFGQKSKESYSMSDYETMYEKQLKEVLSNITGVSDVTVMVNIDSTEETVVERNRTTRTQTTKEADKGVTREVTDQSTDEQVVMAKNDNGEQPVVIKTIKPKVRGVVVVARGAENLQVKAWMLEAVQKVLAVPSYKISILPRNK